MFMIRGSAIITVQEDEMRTAEEGKLDLAFLRISSMWSSRKAL